MNIAILAAGAGDMICGSCLRDSAMATALKNAGHSVTLVPLYTPLRTDGEDLSGPEVFYGGVNVFLQHSSALFRHTPRALDWLLDRPGLLKAAGNWGAQTSPDDVAALTASIIRGDDGSARKELHRLIDHLNQFVQPQIVSLPNLMFIGLAAALRGRLNVPVVCELTGEDIFLEAMTKEHQAMLRDLIRQRVGAVTKFISATDYYANRMADYLAIPRDRIEVIPTGISPEYLTPTQHRNGSARPATVGYMARICPEKGLDRLVDAVLLLRQMQGFEQTRLVAAGYLGARDQKWFTSVKQRIDASPLRDDFTYLGTVDRDEKIKMLDSIDVMSVPTAYEEAKGIYILEALARGVPVVQPSHGSFPELIAQTGGGVLVPPNDPRALAEGLARVLNDSAERDRIGRAGRLAVESNLTEAQMANRLLSVYQALL